MLELERLIIFILVVWGMTNIISGSYIFQPLRDWLKDVRVLGRLLPCYMCTGFWVGLMVSLIDHISRNQFREIGSVLAVKEIFYDGCIGSGTTWILFVILARLGSREL